MIAARARDSTAVKEISPGVSPAVAAARAASPAIMLCASSSAHASWRTSSFRVPAQDVAGAADGPLQVKESDFDQPSFLRQGGQLPGRAQARVQERGEQPDLRGLRAAAAGAGQHGEADQPRDGSGRDGRPGSPARAAAGSHAGLPEQDQLLFVFQHPKGPNGAAFRAVWTRHSRCAPMPENRIKRSMEKKPRSARFSCPGPK